LFSCYEAFVHIVDSMVNQHIKWLRTTRSLLWRAPIASLNYLLTSHVWRQDHNGFSHQGPGFIDHVTNKAPEVVRVYLPPDTNTLLCVADHVLRTRDYVNVVVAGKQPCFDWLPLDQARAHCARGAGIWEWAGTEAGTSEPDVILAAAGDVPTQEVLAAAQLIRRHLPDLAVRVVNVVDLARLLPHEEHPHGIPDREYDALFTRDKPVIVAYHGYPWLIYRRAGHRNLHVRGYKEIGTTTTPFDMVVRNDLDWFRLVMDVIDRVPGLAVRAAPVRQRMEDARLRHHDWIREHGTDLPEVADWSWTGLPADALPAGTFVPCRGRTAAPARLGPRPWHAAFFRLSPVVGLARWLRAPEWRRGRRGTAGLMGHPHRARTGRDVHARQGELVAAGPVGQAAATAAPGRVRRPGRGPGRQHRRVAGAGCGDPSLTCGPGQETSRGQAPAPASADCVRRPGSVAAAV
jgi:hypothetical protein